MGQKITVTYSDDSLDQVYYITKEDGLYKCQRFDHLAAPGFHLFDDTEFEDLGSEEDYGDALDIIKRDAREYGDGPEFDYDGEADDDTDEEEKEPDED